MLGLNCSMWDLVPWPGMEPKPSAFGTWSLREVSPYWPHISSCSLGHEQGLLPFTCAYCVPGTVLLCDLPMWPPWGSWRIQWQAANICHSLRGPTRFGAPIISRCHLPPALLFTWKLSTVPSTTAFLLPNSCLPRDLCTSCSRCLESHPPSPVPVWLLPACHSHLSSNVTFSERLSLAALSKLASASHPWQYHSVLSL